MFLDHDVRSIPSGMARQRRGAAEDMEDADLCLKIDTIRSWSSGLQSRDRTMLQQKRLTHPSERIAAL